MGDEAAGALPPLALSVRQPWAWAIVHGSKDIENRTRGAIRAGGMGPGRVCVHAAVGMTCQEYEWGAWRLARHGVQAPRPDALPRGAVVGVVEVTDLVAQSRSPWFGGPCGLVLRNPVPIEPIPCLGAVGYFRWQPGGALAPAAPWMRAWDRPAGDDRTAPMFGDLGISFAMPPRKPALRTSRPR